MTSGVADDLTELLLRPRQHYLKGKAPRLPYVHDLRRKIRAAVTRPIAALLAVSLADLDDGIAVSIVVQPYEAIIAVLREHAAKRHRQTGLPFAVRLNAAMARETRAEGKLTAWQLCVVADPQNLTLRRELRAASREYRAVLDDLDAMLDDQWAAERLASA